MPSLLGRPALEFKSLDGREALGQLFEYTVRLQTPDSPLLTEHVTANVPVKQPVDKGVQRGSATKVLCMTQSDKLRLKAFGVA
jgi:uncharacterized protein involved in type VI secretion and phage assembly